MSEVLEQAAWFTPPKPGDIVVKDVSSTAQAVDLTSFASDNRFVTVQADGAKLYVLFGQTSLEASALDESLTADAGQCFCIPAGEERSFRMDADGPFFLGVKTSGSDTGKVRIVRSSPAGTRRYTG